MAKASAATPVVAEPKPGPPTSVSDGGRIVATPYARRLSRQAGIDLRAIEGTGPRGRIKAADVSRAIETRPSAAPTEAAGLAQVAGMRTASIYTAGIEPDMTRLVALNEDIKRDAPALRPELTHYIVLAASRALDENGAARDSILIGLASARDSSTETATTFGKDDCRTLSAIIARTEAAIGPLPAHGTLWIDRARDGISFFAADPPPGWSASLCFGTVRRQFRPDAEGRPAPAAAATLVLTGGISEFDAESAQSLLGRIGALLENPLLLLAS